MQHMLRNFLYVDEQLLDDYLSAVEGEIFDESMVIKREQAEGGAGLGLGVGPVRADAGRSRVTGVESTKHVRRTPAAKFQQLYSYLEREDAVCYHETITEECWTGIQRNSVLECVVSPRFSKMDELLSMVNAFGSLAGAIGEVTGERLVDGKATEAIRGLTALGETQRSKGIACVFSFSDSTSFQIVAYLNPTYLRVPKEQIVGDVTLFCKVQKKLAKGDKIELVELFSGLERLPMNREQKRKLRKGAPAELNDTVKGPAAVVIPIAIYR